MQNTSTTTLSVTQPSAAVFRHSTSGIDTNGITKRFSLTDTSGQNLMTTRAKSLLHFKAIKG